jgi:predicted glycoside hydrolase/deacetylase ChbG (UPF0249 family)
MYPVDKRVPSKNMLIITADDWGKNMAATDNTMLCLKNGRITSVSAMVFLRDSERAADLARESGVESGLHLNFSLPFDGPVRSEKLLTSQLRLAAFLEKSRFAPMVYNPFLNKDFEYVYMAQYDEYVRLYGMVPAHINGHRHKHLCWNVLIGGLIPKGSRVRRTFTFSWDEKNAFNLMYRRLIDRIIALKYVCTDSFFSLMPIDNMDRLQRIINLSKQSVVELMVHPERKEEFECLMSDEYFDLIFLAKTGHYGLL